MTQAVCNNNKKVYLEFLRIIAAFFVISNHVNNPIYYYHSMSKSWYAAIVLLFISKTAVPIFLMISGSLLLGKRDTFRKYLLRIIRLCVVLLVFTVIYYIVFTEPLDMGMYHFIKTLFYSATNAYWYIYLYLGILIILPVLQKISMSLSKKEMQLLLFVSLIIGGIFPMIKLFTGIQIKSEFLDVIFSPYLGMLFVGFYIDKYVNITKIKAGIATIGFIILIAVQVLITREYYIMDNQNYMHLDNRIFITISLSAVYMYVFIKYIFLALKWPKVLCKFITYCGSLTFGIYLLSDLITNLTLPYYWDYFLDYNAFFGLFLLAVYVFFVSGIIVAILKCIPYVKKYL